MESVRWAVLGTGTIAERFCVSLSHEKHSRLLFVYGRTPEKAQKLAQKWGAQATQNLDEIIASDVVDAIYIALPHHLHASLAIRALQAHKAVLSEKPAALSAHEMALIAQAAHENQTLYMEAMKCRFVPLAKRITALLTEKKLGKIESISITMARNLEKASYFYEPIDGGVAYDMGIYAASWIGMLVGEKLCVERWEQQTKHMVDVASSTHLLMGSVAVEVKLDGLNAGSINLLVRGSKGTLEIPNFHRPTTAILRVQGQEDAVLEDSYVIDDMFGEITHFVALLRRGSIESQTMSLRDSYDCARIVDAIRSGYDRQNIASALAHIVGDASVRFDEPMTHHTTFKIGGPADLFITPQTTVELASCLRVIQEANMYTVSSQAQNLVEPTHSSETQTQQLKSSTLHTTAHETADKSAGIPFFLLGNGSNILVSDAGYRGIVLEVAQNMSHAHVQKPSALAPSKKTLLTCQAGLSLIDLCEMAAALSLSGLEFACGIPGTVGGAVFMNAGAYGGEIKDVLFCAEVLDAQGAKKTLSNEELHFDYRRSRIDEDELVVSQATFALQEAEQSEIRAKMEEYTRLREEKQPLDMPSAGSTFKRPTPQDGKTIYVGPLIQQAGLQGKQIGGAQVSKRHAGFVVNAGGATARDVIDLIQLIKETIRKHYGVQLEAEVRLLGTF